MNKKNTAIILFTMALCLAFLIPSASAGGRWHQSGFVVVYGYPQPYFYSNFVFAWPPNHGSYYYYPHHPRYHRHIYHRSPPRKHRDYRDDRRRRHR
jgi:hypothetical protein